MLDDGRIRKTLLASGLVTADDLKEIEVLAFRRGSSVYRTSIETGWVNETDAVSHLAGALGVPSVSLEKFTAKPKLLEVLPVSVVRKYRVMPVGLKPRNGELKLFVAMDDPHDLDALEAISHHAPNPVVPLLAGPVDLDRALERVYPGIHDAEPSNPPPAERGPDIFAHVLEDLDGAAPSDVLSALSMLDDIPRNRHDRVTSPSGFQPVRSRMQPASDLATTVENEPSKSSFNSTTQLNRPGAENSVPPAALPAALEVRLSAADPLVAAVTRVLIAKGIITPDELGDALTD